MRSSLMILAWGVASLGGCFPSLPAEVPDTVDLDTTGAHETSPPEDTSVAPPEDTAVAPPEDTPVAPPEDTIAPPEDTTVTPVEDTSVADTSAPIDTVEPDTAVADTSVVDCSHLDGPCVEGVWSASSAACEARVQLGQACDDGDACTEHDVCGAGGACAGVAVDCDDGVACSIDSCDPLTGGCVYETAACACSSNADCADGKPCTDDLCDPTTWTCHNPIAPGNPCNDLDPCTLDDACDALGRCVGSPKVCEDGNVCTTASCNGLTGECVFTPVLDGAACDDGDACTAMDRCVGGTCHPGYLASFDKKFAPYDGPHTRVFQRVAQLPDGGFFIAERIYYDGPGIQGIGALRLSGAGTTIPLPFLFPQLHGPYPEGWTTAALGLEIVGSSAYMLANSNGVAHVDVDTADSKVWYAWEYGTDLTVGAIAIDTNSRLSLWGHRGDSTTGEERLWFGRLDVTGGSVVHAAPSGVQARGVGLRAITGGFFATGVVATPSGGDAWIGRLDADGAIQWGTVIARPGDQRPVAVLPNLNDIVVVGRSNSPIDGEPRPWFARVSYSGQQLADSIVAQEVFHVADAAETPAGGYLLVGHRPISSSGDQHQRAHVMWIDAQGSWVAAQDGPSDHYGFAAVRAIATGYILTGHTGSPNYNSSGRLMVTDFDLATPCDPP